MKSEFGFLTEVQKKYLEEFNTKLYKSYGAVMQGYILIPESMWAMQKLL